MKRSLVFASVHPPGITSAGIRCGKLARAAAKAGFEVHFVHPGARAAQYQWLDGIRCVSFAAPIADRIFRRAASKTSAAPERPRSPGAALVSRTVRRIARAALQPDEFVLEVPRFTRALCSVVNEIRADGAAPIIVGCAPPWSTTLAARASALRTHAPLVLDLQDLWSENPVARWPPLSHALASALERLAFSSASGFIFINERIADRYTARHPVATRRPSVVAHIGSEHPPQAVMKVGPSKALELLHIGSIYGDRDLRPILDACVACRSDGRDVRLVWYGRILGEHPLRSQLDGYRALGVLELHESIPHDRARQRMAEADLLIAVPSPRYAEELTGKLFDYIDAGRPVLGLATPQAFIADVIRDAGIGVAFAPSDVGRISEFLSRACEHGVEFIPVPKVMEPFTPRAMGEAMRQLARDIGK